MLSKILSFFKNWVHERRKKYIHELEIELGPYTCYGSGPWGSSSQSRRELQLELALLRSKVSLEEIKRELGPYWKG
jgi:hypothetical protein